MLTRLSMPRALTLVALSCHLAARPAAAAAKYQFLFIGDGMGPDQVAVSDRCVALAGLRDSLHMTRFPVRGTATTDEARGITTDSAAAATALACGVKTATGTLGMNADYTVAYRTVPGILRERLDWKIGIVSSVSLDHATPAGFYATSGSRSGYAAIALQLASSEFAFFGGGGIKGWKGAAAPRDTVGVALAANGYTVIDTAAGILELQGKPRDRVVCLGPRLQPGPSLPYAIDRAAIDPGGLDLAAYVRAAIACLREAPGFFLMVEGGKIDWACHMNDTATTVREVIDFDQAIGVALEFLAAHPDDTLIVVTADHETGGMRFDPSADGTPAGLDGLLKASTSVERFEADIWPAYRAAHKAGFAPATANIADEADGAFKKLMLTGFGLAYGTLNADAQALLEAAYDAAMGDRLATLINDYGAKGDLAATLAALAATRAGIAWADSNHSSTPVPIYATGADAEIFAGACDNIDLPRKLLRAAGLADVALPVVRGAGAKP